LRLEAEAIRDQALAVSRRLDRQIGGPSVFPFQADGVMEGRSDKSRWIEDETSAAQRRGLYVHFWRLTPHPYLTLFDAPDANASCTRRQRSNTPGLPPNYVPALMRGSRVKGPLLFWSEGVARTGALGMVK